MSQTYYHSEDLKKFPEISKNRPELGWRTLSARKITHSVGCGSRGAMSLLYRCL